MRRGEDPLRVDQGATAEVVPTTRAVASEQGGHPGPGVIIGLLSTHNAGQIGLKLWISTVGSDGDYSD